MSLSFWERLSIITGLIVLAALFGLMVFVANIEIKDLDLWLHIGTGRWIVNNGFQIPQGDILSCTIAGKPWINHEWLFQVIVYWLFNKWGAEGILNSQVVLITITSFILLILGYNKEKQLATIFPLVLLAIVYFGRFTNRPDLFSLFFFAFYIFLLSFFLNQRWTIYVMFICQILWNNIHGFFFFGPLFVLIGLSGEWLKRHAPLPYKWNKIGRLTDQEYKQLKWIFLFVFLACFINPYTFRGAWYPIGVFFELSGKSRIFFQNIVELQKPITFSNIFSANQYPHYKLLIMISSLSFFFNRRKIDIGGLIFWVVFLGFSLVAIRNMIFFAFAAYLAFVTNALTVSMRDLLPLKVVDKKFIHVTSIVVKLCFLGWIIQYGSGISLNGYYDFDKYDWKSEFGGISQRQYPDKAADFLVENNVKANMMNGFNTGAYLVGRCFPNIKVYIDGRTEVYGPEFFSQYKTLWETGSPGLVKEAIKRYDINAIFVHTLERQAPTQFLKSVHALEDFVPVYLDYDGIIYLKDIPQHQEVIAQHRLDLENWQPKGLDIYRMGYSRVIPYRSMNRAYTLDTLGYADSAMREIEETLKISPTYIETYKLGGKIFAERGEYDKAFEDFRIAVMMNPHDHKMRMNLTLSYFHMEKYDLAAKNYEKIIEKWPSNPEAYFKLSRTYIYLEKYDKALNILKRGLDLAPKAAMDSMTLADMFAERGRDAEAKKAYQFIKDVKGQQGVMLHYKLARVFQRMGDKPQAKEEYEKVLELQPGNQMIKDNLTNLMKE